MTDKQKNIALVIGFLLLLIVSYVFSIKKTLELKSRLVSLEKDKELLSNASERIYKLQQENKYLDAVLQKKELTIDNSFQQLLLSKINKFKNKNSIEVIAFNQPHKVTKNNTSLQTYSFEVKGSFNALLQLTNFIERQQLGELISVNFEKKRNYRKNKEELTGIYYLQKLEQEN
jgi:hypothetical protein